MGRLSCSLRPMCSEPATNNNCRQGSKKSPGEGRGFEFAGDSFPVSNAPRSAPHSRQSGS